MTRSLAWSKGRSCHWLALPGWFLICFLAASLGAFFGPGAWYESLAKPFWNPPGWIFGPVWGLLYTLMAVAAWLIWREGGWQKQRGPIGIFLWQLALNALWSPLFFGLQMPGIACAEILLLWGMIVATIRVFYPVNPRAAMLLVPYLAWVSFASILNGTLWYLNA
ncbi:tryptophan-rich sensory protein [Verrucomicrobia bacterium]|nr:tryptophan-rich sensory protein [Verrucomicrobiota bacterium]MDG1890732.1 tryptophan-rich sensory protein [Verrucomicrobiota bacterium]